mgnify:CR=1 FL=1
MPIERVENAIIAAEELGFRYGISSIFLSYDSPTSYDMRNREIIKRLKRIATSGIFGDMPVKFIGRAVSLSNLREGELYIPDETCDTTREGISFRDPESASIDPYGRICICPPMAIDDVKRRQLSKVLMDWNYDQHPIVKVLVEEGPLGLTKLPEEEGVATIHCPDPKGITLELRQIE